MATIECQDCLDHFCQGCFEEVHSKPPWQSHKRVPLTLYAGHAAPDVPAPENGKLLLTGAETNDQDAKADTGTNWKKFEYFNFPIPETND